MMNSVSCVIDSCDAQISPSDTNSLHNHLCVHLNYYPFGCGYCIENGRKDRYFATERSLVNHSKSHHTAKEIKIFEDVNEKKELRLRELIGQMSANSHMTPEKQGADQSKRASSDEREDVENLQTVTSLDRSPYRKKQKVISSSVDQNFVKVPTSGKSPPKARKSISPRKSPNKFPFLPGQKLLSDFYAPKCTASFPKVDSSNIGPDEPEQLAETGTKDELHVVFIETVPTVHSPAVSTPHTMEQKDSIPMKTNQTDPIVDVPTIECRKCSRKIRIFDLYLHMLTHTAKPSFECTSCQCSYRSYNGCQRHIDKYHPGKITNDFRCKEAQEELTGLWFGCFGIVDGRMHCSMCNKTISPNNSRTHVKWHLKTLGNEVSLGHVAYQCFGKQTDLLAHQEVLLNRTEREPDEHSASIEGESPSDPPTSTSASQSASDTSDSGKSIPPPEAHEVTTETDTPLPIPDSAETLEALNCMKCNQSVRLRSLSQHLLSHTTEPAFKCVPCNRAWRFKSGIQKHINNMHPGKRIADLRRLEADEELANLAYECYGYQELFCALCKAHKGLSSGEQHVEVHLKRDKNSTYARVAYDCFGHHCANGRRPTAPQPNILNPQNTAPTSIQHTWPNSMSFRPDHNESALQTVQVLKCSLCAMPTAEPEWHVFQCHMQIRKYPFKCTMCEFKDVTYDSFPEHYQFFHNDSNEMQTIITDLEILKVMHDQVNECFN